MHRPAATTQLCAILENTIAYPTIFMEISAANHGSCMRIASDCRIGMNPTLTQISTARIPHTGLWIKYLGHLLFLHLPALPDRHEM
jgi:hypothetical protein